MNLENGDVDTEEETISSQIQSFYCYAELVCFQFPSMLLITGVLMGVCMILAFF